VTGNVLDDHGSQITHHHNGDAQQNDPLVTIGVASDTGKRTLTPCRQKLVDLN
jgi:hypothetical protein